MLIKRNCLICDKEFETYHSVNKRVCSKECRLKLQSRLTKGKIYVERISKYCKYCKNEFIVPRYLKNRVYCSLVCKNKGQDSSHLIKYAVKKGQEAWNKGKRWSEETHYKNRKGKYLKCVLCEKIIYLPQYRLIQGKNHFCSQLCQNLFQWKPNKIKKSYPAEFSFKLKEKIKNRDGHKCVLCNMSEEEHIRKYNCRLHIHHIDHDIYNCNEDNLVTVCLRHNEKANNKENNKYWIYSFKTAVEFINGILRDDTSEEEKMFNDLKQQYHLESIGVL